MVTTAAIASTAIEAAVAFTTVITVHRSEAVVLVGALGVLYFLAFLIVVVLYLNWVAEIVKNTGCLTGRKPPFTATYAVSIHLLPVVGLYRPWFVIRTVWASTARPEDQGSGMRLIGWWWWVWVVSNFASLAIGAGIFNNPTNLHFASVAQSADVLLDVAVTVLFIRVIKMISAAQDQGAEALGLIGKFA
jgi:hypothetical protein